MSRFQTQQNFPKKERGEKSPAGPPFAVVLLFALTLSLGFHIGLPGERTVQYCT